MSVQFRLKELMAERARSTGKRVTYRSISDATEIHIETLHKAVTNQHEVVGLEVLDRLCIYFGCNIGDLLIQVDDGALTGDAKGYTSGVSVGVLLDGMELPSYHEDRVRLESGEYVYVLRDEDTALYVGQSHRPIRRFTMHMGLKSKSPVGKLVRANLPASRKWTMEFLTIEECRPQAIDYVTSHPDPSELRPIDSPILVERAMIRHYRPCLNLAYNPSPRPLPAYYVIPESFRGRFAVEVE